MAEAIVTGSGGLIGSAAVDFLVAKGLTVIGIDNDLRQYFFGEEASTEWRVNELKANHRNYRHENVDVRDTEGIERIVRGTRQSLELVIHAAAQPSHDWAAREPFTDFGVNALGTLNLLEAVRKHAPHVTFVFLSTNKVYGDAPNALPLVELETRWELDPAHRYFERGIDETLTIDQSTHSLFGVSKVAADVLVQEYGRYFQLSTACFRGGCLTGGSHSSAELHGFLAYLMKCTVTGRPYTVFGHGGKQVRDNIHSDDLVRAIWCFSREPKCAAVYNIGGGRHANCSVIEAIALCEEIAGRRLRWSYSTKSRVGDHIWWISDFSRFQRDYPEFTLAYDLPRTLESIYEMGSLRWKKEFA